MIKNAAVGLYHLLRQNRMTFRTVIRLKELGANRFVKDITGLNSTAACLETNLDGGVRYDEQQHPDIRRLYDRGVVFKDIDQSGTYIGMPARKK